MTNPKATRINIHTHVFNVHCIPNNFPNSMSHFLSTTPVISNITRFTLHNLWPFSNHDHLDRLLNIVKIAGKRNQFDIIKELTQYYDKKHTNETWQFVVLPMDLSVEYNGHVQDDLTKQHDEILAIKNQCPDLWNRIIPFVSIDPRNKKASKKPVEFIRHYIENGFQGIKIYPQLGYAPDSPEMMPIWEFANEYVNGTKKGLPVIAHCSYGGVGKKYFGIKDRKNPGHPMNYLSILDKYQSLRICFSHLGGEKEWQRYAQGDTRENWLSDILWMMQRYNNVYGDISYNIASIDPVPSIITQILTQTPLYDRILFGSDYFMNTKEFNNPSEENILSARAAKAFPSPLWPNMAEANAIRFIG